MKNWKKIFNIIVVVVMLFSFSYIFLLLKAKNIITKSIEQATGRKVSVARLIIKPPLNLEISDLQIEGLVKAGYIYISPSIPSLLFGKLAFNKVKINSPQFTFERTAPAANISDSSAAIEVNAPVAREPSAEEQKKTKELPISIKSLKIYSGRLNFIDTTSPSGVINFVVKEINLFATNLSNYNVNSVTNFNLKGNISWNTGEPDGKIYFDGWADFNKKDIQAELKIENIDAIVFYPYYSTWVDLGKARIEKAKLNFLSKIKGKNNNVDAVCHLELVDIVRKARPPEEAQEKAERLTDAVLDMFKTMNQGKVVLDFTLHTKMDQPIFGFGDIKSAFEGKLAEGRAKAGMRPQDMLLFPAKMLQSGVKSGRDFSAAAVDGIFALGNGIKKFFEDMINSPAPANQF